MPLYAFVAYTMTALLLPFLPSYICVSTVRYGILVVF